MSRWNRRGPAYIPIYPPAAPRPGSYKGAPDPLHPPPYHGPLFYSSLLFPLPSFLLSSTPRATPPPTCPPFYLPLPSPRLFSVLTHLTLSLSLSLCTPSDVIRDACSRSLSLDLGHDQPGRCAPIYSSLHNPRAQLPSSTSKTNRGEGGRRGRERRGVAILADRFSSIESDRWLAVALSRPAADTLYSPRENPRTREDPRFLDPRSLPSGPSFSRTFCLFLFFLSFFPFPFFS